MDATKNFSPEEFECKCCGKEVMDQGFIERLQKAREIARVPFKINSGYRCVKYNKKIGSSITSSHIIGHAVDIRAVFPSRRFSIINGLLKSGFMRIGIGENFVHVDDDRAKPWGVIWAYPKKE